MSYLLLKWLHIISSTVLLGAGAGIAFFMWRAHRTRDARIVAAVAADVVRADFLFTATAVVLQPVTGFLLLWKLGYPWTVRWRKAMRCPPLITAASAAGSCWAGRPSPQYSWCSG